MTALRIAATQPIPAWARLRGRRAAGQTEWIYALVSPMGSAMPWSVPVELSDEVPAVTEVELWGLVAERLGARDAR